MALILRCRCGRLGGIWCLGGTFGGLMTAVAVPEEEAAGPGNRVWKSDQYLSDLNKTAIYAVTRGMPFLLATHAAFLVTFVDAWIKEPQSAKEAAEALFGRWPQWSRSEEHTSELQSLR